MGADRVPRESKPDEMQRTPRDADLRTRFDEEKEAQREQRPEGPRPEERVMLEKMTLYETKTVRLRLDSPLGQGSGRTSDARCDCSDFT